MPRRESSGGGGGRSRRDGGRRSSGGRRDGGRRSRRGGGARGEEDPDPYESPGPAGYEAPSGTQTPEVPYGGAGGGMAAAREGLLQNQPGGAVPPGGGRPHVDFTPLRTKLVVWNAVLLLFGVTLLVEGMHLMYQAYGIGDAVAAHRAGGVHADKVVALTDEAATEGGLGASVVMAGLLAFILAATQYTQCCHAECCAQMSYIIWSMFLVIYELGVSFAVIAVANWDKVQKKLADQGLDQELNKIAVPAYSKGAKMNLYVVVGVLVASGIMQIGAVVLHVKRRTELENWFIMDPIDDQTAGDTGSYGSGSGKNSNRLAELRDYYAQLYAEHGLSVPSELRNPHPV